MRKHLLVLLLISVSVFTASAHGRKTTRKKTKAIVSTASVKGLASVSMQRGACFGRCPEYVLTISSNGMAEYKGTRNADPMGVYEKNIGAAKAQDLLKEFMDRRADTCSTTYRQTISDVPGLYYVLTINGRQQAINNASFGPSYLTELAGEMDALCKIDGTWKKISDKAMNEK